MPSAVESLSAARRVVVKVGSSLVIDPAGEGVRGDWLASLAADISALRSNGCQVLIVSSGAVALGRRRLGMRPSARLAHKQAAAAAGQTLLMQAWDQAFAPHGYATAQLLLTLDDTERRRRWLNARGTIETLLANAALPVINENDSVATDELRYGDNDRLSARVAQMVGSDLLILLSDIDGLYTTDPRGDSRASLIPLVETIDARIEACAGGSAAGGIGSGGMRTKIAAAKIAGEAGCATIIASGRELHPLDQLRQGAPATLFVPTGTPSRAYKQWIAGTLVPAGKIVVDEGAQRALETGRSLLPAGAARIDGEFERGSCLAILGPAGDEFGRGITAYSSEEARMIIGASSSAIEARLGYTGPDELIHRDDLVLLGR